MNLLKFIELQNMDTFLHKLPIPIKIVPFILAILIPKILWSRELILYSQLAIIIICAILIGYCLGSPEYVVDILTAFVFLWIFLALLYSPVINPILFLIRYYNQLIYLISISITFILFLSTTSVSQLERFLNTIGLSYKYSRVLIVTYNLIPALYQEVKMITITQRARGLKFSQNPIKRAIQMVSILLPLLFVSILRAEMLEQSIKSRGG